MKSVWPLSRNLDHNNQGPHSFPGKFNLSPDFNSNLTPHLSSIMENSFNHTKHVYMSGNLVMLQMFSRFNKLAGALFSWFSTASLSNNPLRISSDNSSTSMTSQSLIDIVASGMQNVARSQLCSHSKEEYDMQTIFTRFASMTVGPLWKGIEQKNNWNILALSSINLPPFEDMSSELLTNISGLENNSECDRELSKNDKEQGHANLSFCNINWSENAVEAKTGIKFPTFLEVDSNPVPEVLVATGSKSMRILALKTLRVYAFGLYVQPGCLCEKLCPKYASLPTSHLKECPDFYNDLLRADIHMTVRLVVNCKGLSISTVRDAFEKSLRVRLLKINPETDYDCLRTFRSYFSQDIPIPVGTTINFKRTTDGQLITEIDGKRMGSVQCKDLCRAFFDMYIGDTPVSPEAKDEIAQNVNELIRRC